MIFKTIASGNIIQINKRIGTGIVCEIGYNAPKSTLGRFLDDDGPDSSVVSTSSLFLPPCWNNKLKHIITQ